MLWWLSLFQTVRVATCNLSITHDYLFPSLFSMYPGLLEIQTQLLISSNFGLGSRQFECTAAHILKFLQNMILRVFFVD